MLRSRRHVQALLGTMASKHGGRGLHKNNAYGGVDDGIVAKDERSKYEFALHFSETIELSDKGKPCTLQHMMCSLWTYVVHPFADSIKLLVAELYAILAKGVMKLNS